MLNFVLKKNCIICEMLNKVFLKKGNSNHPIFWYMCMCMYSYFHDDLIFIFLAIPLTFKKTHIMLKFYLVLVSIRNFSNCTKKKTQSDANFVTWDKTPKCRIFYAVILILWTMTFVRVKVRQVLASLTMSPVILFMACSQRNPKTFRSLSTLLTFAGTE